MALIPCRNIPAFANKKKVFWRSLLHHPFYKLINCKRRSLAVIELVIQLVHGDRKSPESTPGGGSPIGSVSLSCREQRSVCHDQIVNQRRIHLLKRHRVKGGGIDFITYVQCSR